MVTEMQVAISQSIKDEVKEEMQQSSVYGIMIDEATDISTNASLIVYAYFVHDGKRKMRYLADVQLEGCDVSSILTVILRVLEDYEVSIKKCFGFGSDGASVMTGRENGVAALLKRENPYVTSIHCVAHRLALAEIMMS